MTLAEEAVEEMEIVSVRSIAASAWAAAWRSGVLVEAWRREELLKLNARRRREENDFPLTPGGARSTDWTSTGSSRTTGVSSRAFPRGDGWKGVCCSC
jgi:hypothetical protein